MGFIGDLFGGGGGSSQPVQTVQAQNTPQFAAEQKPYVEKIFEEAQNLYEQRVGEGFQPFPGPQLAPLAPEEQEALRGIAQLARGPGPAQDFAKGREALMMSAAPIGQQDIQRLMSPYAQNVIDIEKREAAREFQKQLPQIAGSAVAQGGLRGSRRAILEAEAGRNLQQQLGDIQTRGLQSAYDRALQEAARERGRLAVLSEALPRLGQAQYTQGLQQLTQLGGVGETQRAQQQAAIDLARQQFELEKAFPEQALSQFTGFVRGVPSPTGFSSTSTTSQPAPSGLGQLAALGLTGAQILGGSSGSSILGKLLGMASGGRVGGLSSVVRRNRGGQVVRMQQGAAVPAPATPFMEDIRGVIDYLTPDISRNLENAMARAEAESARRSKNIENAMARAEAESALRSAYFGGTREELETAKTRQSQLEKILEGNKLESKEPKPAPAPVPTTPAYTRVEEPPAAAPDVEKEEGTAADDTTSLINQMLVKKLQELETPVDSPDTPFLASALALEASQKPGAGVMDVLAAFLKGRAAEVGSGQKAARARQKDELTALTALAQIQGTKEYRDAMLGLRQEGLDVKEATKLTKPPTKTELQLAAAQLDVALKAAGLEDFGLDPSLQLSAIQEIISGQRQKKGSYASLAKAMVENAKVRDPNFFGRLPPGKDRVIEEFGSISASD